MESAHSDVFTCSLCNSSYNNMLSFRQHQRFHEDEASREHRNLMMNNVVSMCYDPSTSL